MDCTNKTVSRCGSISSSHLPRMVLRSLRTKISNRGSWTGLPVCVAGRSSSLPSKQRCRNCSRKKCSRKTFSSIPPMEKEKEVGLYKYVLYGTILKVSDIAKIITANGRASNCFCLQVIIVRFLLTIAYRNLTCERRGDFRKHSYPIPLFAMFSGRKTNSFVLNRLVFHF